MAQDVNPNSRLAAPPRLTRMARSEELLPWRRAEEFTQCYLYWMPTSAFPMPAVERQWFLNFLRRLADLMAKGFGLRPEVFLQGKTLELSASLKKEFLKLAMDLRPVLGLSRRPNAQLPPLPSEEDIKDFQEGRKKFKFGDYVADYSYWFRTNAFTKGLETFLGHSGMTMIFLKPDPKAQPPQIKLPKMMREHPMLKQLDLEQATAAAFALLAGFPAKSKEIFGRGLEHDPQFKGLIYILPLLKAGDFFGQPEQEINNWFELFDIYINESPDDKGIVMATKKNFEEDLIQLLKEMSGDALECPQR